MKMRCLFTIVFGIICAKAWAQRDTISCKRSNFPTMYKMDGRNIWTMRRLQQIMKDDAEALEQVKRGKKVAFIGGACYAAGLLIIGAELGRASMPGSVGVRPAVIAAGAGVVGVSVPLFFSARKRVREGVLIYNGHVKEGALSGL